MTGALGVDLNADPTPDPELLVWAQAFLRIPGATITLTEWATLSDKLKVAFMRAGVLVQAEQLLKLSQALRGDHGLADAVSEADGGTWSRHLNLRKLVDVMLADASPAA